MPDFDDEKSTDAAMPRPSLLEASAKHGYLLILSSRALTTVGKMFRLERRELVLGRSAEADIKLDDPGISRRHARFIREENTYRVEDLDSRNGTFLNGERVKSAALTGGDKIQLGSTTILLFSVQDELEENFQRSLYESATRDGLTGLLNRQAAMDALATEVAFGERHRAPVSVVMVDIDHFKTVNDTHGHPAGDTVLIGVAQMLASTTRAEDVVARYGGEEFLLVLRQTGPEAANRCAQRCRRAVEAGRFRVGGQELAVTISAGTASLGAQGAQTPQALVAEADRRLYEAKAGGRNAVVSSPTGDAFREEEAPRGAEQRAHARIETDLVGTLRVDRGASSARIRDLSVAGALVMAPPGLAAAGAAVILELEGSGGSPLSLNARVIWRDAHLTGGHYGLQFESLTPPQTEGLRRCLDQVLLGRGQGTREYPRVHRRIGVEVKSLEHASAMMLDISRGGLGIISDTPVVLGDHLELLIEFSLEAPGLDQPLSLPSDVVRVSPAAAGQYQIGLKFAPLEAARQQQLDGLIRALLAAPHPHGGKS